MFAISQRDDHLPVAHVVFFDLRALADAAELDERVARVAFVFGADDLVVVRLVDQPELDELRVGQEVERDEIGARLLERRVLLLQHRLRVALAAARRSCPSRGRSPRACWSSARRRTLLHFSARSASSGAPGELAAELAAASTCRTPRSTFDSDTDLLP